MKEGCDDFAFGFDPGADCGPAGVGGAAGAVGVAALPEDAAAAVPPPASAPKAIADIVTGSIMLTSFPASKDRTLTRALASADLRHLQMHGRLGDRRR